MYFRSKWVERHCSTYEYTGLWCLNVNIIYTHNIIFYLPSVEFKFSFTAWGDNWNATNLYCLQCRRCHHQQQENNTVINSCSIIIIIINITIIILFRLGKNESHEHKRIWNYNLHVSAAYLVYTVSVDGKQLLY